MRKAVGTKKFQCSAGASFLAEADETQVVQEDEEYYVEYLKNLLRLLHPLGRLV